MQEGKRGRRGPGFWDLKNVEHLTEPGNSGRGPRKMLQREPLGEGGLVILRPDPEMRRDT